MDLIVGKRPVAEALASNYPIREIQFCGKLDDSIYKAAQAKKIPVKKVASIEVDGIKNAQGVAAVAGKFHYASLEEVTGDGLIVMCDHITDVHNLGAIIRSAESVGALAVIIPNARNAEVNATVFKTSAGAVCHIPIVQVANIARSLEVLKDNGFWVVGASEHSDNLMWDANMEGKIALVLGNEEKGISQIVLKECDDTFKLPMKGEVSSLNVAQASTVFMYEYVRQNG